MMFDHVKPGATIQVSDQPGQFYTVQRPTVQDRRGEGDTWFYAHPTVGARNGEILTVPASHVTGSILRHEAGAIRVFQEPIFELLAGITYDLNRDEFLKKDGGN